MSCIPRLSCRTSGWRTSSRSIEIDLGSSTSGRVLFPFPFCLRNEHRRNELTVQLTWMSKADYLNWARSEDFRRVHARERELIAAGFPAVKPLVRKYEVVAT